MKWVATQRLVKNGGSTAVTIPKAFLNQLGWLCGRGIVIEMTENCDQLILRLPVPSDFGPVGPPRIERREAPVQS
jgi:hypothetical protein